MHHSLFALGLAAALALGTAAPLRANQTSDMIAAGVVGVALGAAIAHNSGHHHSGSNKFSPKPGVTCYNKQRACYHDDGSYAAHMTHEFF